MEYHHKVSVIHRFSDRTHKEMETISGCQDNFSYNEAKNCFAIADGATQSFYSSIWSKLLVEHFCENPDIDKENWQEWLKPIQEKWLEEVKAELEIAKSGNNFAWIEIQNCLSNFKSATSTFIGLQFIENQAKISIVGDSCLFIFRGNQLIQTHLLQDSTDFNYQPKYFGSRSKNNDYNPEFLDIELEYKQDSDKLYFVLATDALAEYIFKYTEQQRDILTILLTINSEQAFENFVKSARHNGTIKMKNDDVTLMILEVRDREILSSPRQPIKENEGNPPNILPSSNENKQPVNEDQNNSSKGAEEPKDNTPDENLEDTSGFAKIAKIRSNLQTLLKPLLSLPMMHPNSTGASSSSRQPREENQPVIKGIDGIRNILFVFISLNIFLSATILYFISQTANKINSIKTEQSSNLNSPSQVTKYEPKYRNLEKGNKIYKDQTFQEIIIPALSDSSQVLILEEGDKWIKFQIDLYANQAILNQCSTCARDEIEIKPDTNLRIFPSESEGDVFGQLSEPSKFKQLEFDSLPNWSKFTFVGYVKK